MQTARRPAPAPHQRGEKAERGHRARRYGREHPSERIDGVTDAILETYRAKKPIMAMCIAPIVVAKVLGKYGVGLTLGTDDNTAAKVAKGFGCRIEACKPTEVCVDDINREVTTPAYMVATHISEIFDGAENMVAAFEKLQSVESI